MKKIKLNDYRNLNRVKEINAKEFIIDIEDCKVNQKSRIIDFFVGLTYFNGSIRKLNNHEYAIKIG